MECYFDYSATSLIKPHAVGENMLAAVMGAQIGNPSRGGHQPALNAYRLVYEGRARVKEFFNVPSSDQVIYTMNGTMSLNLVINGLFGKGDHVITSCWEHNSVLRPLYQLEKKGLELSLVSCESPSGNLKMAEFSTLIQPNTRAIIISDASNVLGNQVDLAYLRQICQDHELLLIVDACQSAGLRQIDMQAEGIDVLCFTGHKSLYGPQGIGGICFLNKLPFQQILVGGSGVHSQAKEHPKGFPTVLEAGTLNTPGIVGLTAGINYINNLGLKVMAAEAQSLADYFYRELRNQDLLIFYGDYETTQRMPLVSFRVKGISSALVADFLSYHHQIATRPGLHCAPLIHENLGTTDWGLVRFSFSHFNTLAEVKYAIAAVKDLLDKVESGELGE